MLMSRLGLLWMWIATLLKSVRLVTIVMVALCLVPAGAHFFELANKMSLSPADI